jgi:hypothetical protein
MRRLACITTLAVAFAAPASAQQPKQVGLNDAPPHVSAAALAAANGVKFEKVEIEFEDGHAVFEFIGKGPSGKGYEVDVFHDGTIQEVEEEISMSDVPQVVRDTLNRFLPNIQPSKIEKSTRSNFTIWYEFDAKDARGKEIDVDISGDGRRILIQDDDAG